MIDVLCTLRSIDLVFVGALLGVIAGSLGMLALMVIPKIEDGEPPK